MKTLILQGARKVFLENGVKESTIRKIAKQIEYSPGTIYLYFKNKDEILYALHVQGFELFYQYLNEGQHLANPVERLHRMGAAYLRFTHEHPDLYDLMFIANAPMNAESNQEGWDCGMKAHGLLRNTIQACISEGYFPPLDVDAATLGIWGMTHGIASLQLRSRLDMIPEEHTAELVELAMRQVIDMHAAKAR
ncbi:MAG: TetR/AcrR family transcriptional regulator [Bacteroidia bacterium]